MRLIETGRLGTELRAALDRGDRADYVYSYPPRQTYRPVPRADLDGAVVRSLGADGPLNLYFHFPFCRQICSFCNLYAVAGSEDLHRRYMDAVLAETRHYAPQVRHRDVDTVYLGGGTPSLLDPALFAELFETLRETMDVDVLGVAEVALEVAPDTVDVDRFDAYRALGINRVNLGAQSWDPAELTSVGRSHGPDAHVQALDVVQGIGFDNVCVDLIYGLDGQTDDSWLRSVQAVIDRRPETVCCYPLTIRAHTGYGRRGLPERDAETQYARYDTAHGLLTDAGYAQQTHVRWARGAGGYRQKANHWAGHDILGIGAGARGYLSRADYRNGYSARHRVKVLRDYMSRVEQVGHGRDEGFLMDDDERRRKSVVLGLGRGPNSLPVVDWFPEEARDLVAAGAAVRDGSTLRLTARGMRHRDVVVQAFISDRVRELIETHDYSR